jgi:hypothetical protein
MPSRARRVPLTIYDQELDDVLDEVARLQGIPKTKIIMNILLEMKPVLFDLVGVLKMAHAKKDPTSLLMTMASRSLGNLSEEISAYNKFRDSSLAPDVHVDDTGEQALPRPSSTEQNTEEKLDIFPEAKDADHAND